MTKRRDAIESAHHWAELADDLTARAEQQRDSAARLAGVVGATREHNASLVAVFELTERATEAREHAVMWAQVAPLLEDVTCDELSPSFIGATLPCIRSEGHASVFHKAEDGRMWRATDPEGEPR